MNFIGWVVRCEKCSKLLNEGHIVGGLCMGCFAEKSVRENFQKIFDDTLFSKLTTSLTINKLVKQAHENAKEKGWWDKEASFGELISLCHAELSEALEDYRDGEKISRISYGCEKGRLCLDYPHVKQCGNCEFGKPVGIPIELADVVIRISDMCGHYEIDLEAAITEKMEYNKTRSHRHGDEVI